MARIRDYNRFHNNPKRRRYILARARQMRALSSGRIKLYNATTRRIKVL